MKICWTKIAAALSCLALLGAMTAISQAAVTHTQKGTLRLTLGGELAPRSLPRKGTAPISFSVDWNLTTTDQSAVPKLKTLGIEINRHGHFDTTGLSTCDVSKIQPASTARALSACRSSLVGQGHFGANVAIKGQLPYDTGGRLLVFNGRQHGKPVLLGQIYSPHPFPTSFVIVFKVDKSSHGTYGTTLSATLPKALSSWGNLTAIEMTLSRRWSSGGARRSYLSAGCPAPKGFPGAPIKLVRTSFAFAGGTKLTSILNSECKVR